MSVHRPAGRLIHRRYFHQQSRPDDALHSCNYVEIDKQTNRHHEDADSTLESDVDTILKDGKGNL
ncbi:MAG: hypothetical protein OES23_01915 [Nitrosopumilus sp.]|nr:hypothetical protein [Nitrosopumilus sp.]